MMKNFELHIPVYHLHLPDDFGVLLGPSQKGRISSFKLNRLSATAFSICSFSESKSSSDPPSPNIGWREGIMDCRALGDYQILVGHS